MAAYAARAISMRTAIVIAYYRGKVAKPMEGLGAMALRSNARQLWMVRLPRPEGYLQGRFEGQYREVERFR
jgi:hypothetical protein